MNYGGSGTPLHAGAGAIDLYFPKQAEDPAPIYASADGIVSNRWPGVGGRGLFLDHVIGGQHWTTAYLHLSAFSSNIQSTLTWGKQTLRGEKAIAGQKVMKGDPIGYMGGTAGDIRDNTFRSNAFWHLHYGTYQATSGANMKNGGVAPWTVCPSLTNSRSLVAMRSGNNTQTRAANAARTTPPAVAQQQAAQLAQQTPGTNVTSTLISPIREAIKEFEKSLLLGQGQGLMRAYPTFKLYFIEDDSGERRRLGFDDFFSYNAIQSIRFIESNEIAASLCEIVVTNISGVLSNRKFRQKGVEIDPVTGIVRSTGDKPRDKNGNPTKESTSAMKADTRDENPIASLLLQEGIDIHLRLGFSSDPDLLDTVFNGTIVEVEFSESDDIVRILAQSHALELVQAVKGIDKPITKSALAILNKSSRLFPTAGSTGYLLEDMMAQPEVVHFGRWKAADGLQRMQFRELLTQRWTFRPQLQDDNIFAPTPDQELKLIAGGTIFQTLSYTIYRTTIWDIFQEMTLRHPNFIARPVPYKDRTGQRMTMFFGLPNQLYFARDPSVNENIADLKMKYQTTQLGNITIPTDKGATSVLGAIGQAALQVPRAVNFLESSAYKAAIAKYTASGAIQQAKENAATAKMTLDRLNLALASGYIRPFRNYHLITSSQHIIANNIMACSRDVANTIALNYSKKSLVGKTAGVLSGALPKAVSTSEETFILKLDAALPAEETRTQPASFTNVDNEELAKRYATGLLMRNCKNIYRGELIIIGNPKIKVGDVVYLFDDYTDMQGAFEVQEVQHIFDQQSGFRTEIKPGMLVQASEWSLLTSAEALGIVMEGALKTVYGGVGAGAGAQVGLMGGPTGMLYAAGAGLVPGDWGRQRLSFLPFIMGHATNAFGGFLANKIVDFTSLAQPVVMSPMLHHGEIFAGGVPTRKLPVSPWTTMFGRWTSAVDVGYNAWLEDVKAATMGWITTKTGQHQNGNFWSQGGESLAGANL